jgi:hypothetical protein
MISKKDFLWRQRSLLTANCGRKRGGEWGKARAVEQKKK